MVDKIISAKDAAALVKDGMVVMVGGFEGAGTPHQIVEELIKMPTKNLTLVCNDGGFGITEQYPEGYGSGKLILHKQCSKMIASHVGLNKEISNQMNSGELQVTLVPQGSLAEIIRAGGYGLGGVLTEVGIGCEQVEAGKQKVTIDGKEYLIEKALKGDIALVGAKVADKYGNITFHGSTRNFGELMLYACPNTVVEVEKVVDCLDPDFIHVPGALVKHIVVKK